MHVFAADAPVVVFKRAGVCVFILLIDLAGSHTVAKHLYDIDQRHLDRYSLALGNREVRPVFEMMFVPALVVHPCRGASEFPALFSRRTSVAPDIVSDTGDEFGRAVFGQVMQKTAPGDAAPEAVGHDEVSVSCDGMEVTEELVHGRSMVRA